MNSPKIEPPPVHRWQGPKYDAGLSGAKLTAAIRADLKAAVLAKTLPPLTYSVRLQTASMMQAVRVRISGATTIGEGKVYDRAKWEWSETRDGVRCVDGPRSRGYLPGVELVLETVKEIVLAYQRGASEPQSDYHYVNFYEDVTLDDEGDFARLEEELNPKTVRPMEFRPRPIRLETPPGFYVSVIDGHRAMLLAGPYVDHDAAKADVERVRALANEGDCRAAFYGFGTCRVKSEAERTKEPQ